MVTFDEAMLNRDRRLAIRMGSFSGTQIKSASFDYGFQSGDTYTTGGTNAGSAKVELDGIYSNIKALDVFRPEIALKVNAAFEWVKMGEYFVKDIKIDRNKNTTSLELIDGMFKLNQPFKTDLKYPAQLLDVIKEICAKTGITLASQDLGLKATQYHIQKRPEGDKLTFREVLSQVIQLLGFNAYFDRNGKLAIKGLTDSGITITADNYFLHGLEKSELAYQIAGVTCKTKDTTLTVGLRTGRSLEIENDFMIQNMLDDLYYDLKNITYYPYSLKWQGHLKLEVGQWVTIKTNKNETYKVPVFAQSFDFAGGLSSKISADSKASNDTQYAYSGFLTKRIEQRATQIEAEVQQQLEYAETKINQQLTKDIEQVNAAVKQSQAEGQAYADSIKQNIDTQINQINQTMSAAETARNEQYLSLLSKAQANLSLAEEAKNGLEVTKQAAIAEAAKLIKASSENLNGQIEAVTHDVDKLKGTIESKVSKVDAERIITNAITQSEKGTIQRISEVEGKIPTEIGVSNLLTATKTLANNQAKRFVTSESYQDFAIAKSIIPATSTETYVDTFKQWTSVIANADTYIVSFYAKADSQIDIVCHFYDPNTTTSAISSTGQRSAGVDGTIKVTIGTEWQRYWVVWTQIGAKTTTAKAVIIGRHYSKSINFYMCAPALYEGSATKSWSPAPEDMVSSVKFNEVKDTVDSHTRTISEQDKSISQIVQTAQGLVSRVEDLAASGNLVYDPTNYSRIKPLSGHNPVLISQDAYKVAHIIVSGLTAPAWKGFWIPLLSSKFTKGEQLSYRIVVSTNVVPDDVLRLEIDDGSTRIAYSSIRLTKIGKDVVYTGTFNVERSTTSIGTIGMQVYLRQNGSIGISQISIVRGSIPPGKFEDATSAQELAIGTQVNQLAGSWAVQNLTSAGTVLNQLNLNKDGSVKIDGKLVQITGTTYIQDGVITSAKIADLDAGKIKTGLLDAARIAAGSIDASKLVVDQALFNKLTANETLTKTIVSQNAFLAKVQAIDISATRIKGGALRALNGATEFDLQTGSLNFYTNSPALRRILSGYPTQFVKFDTGTVSGKGEAGVTVIGSNRYGTESSNDGGFVGLRAWNGNGVDSLDLVGDKINLVSSAYSDQTGWQVSAYGKLLIEPVRAQDRRGSALRAGDVHLFLSGTNQNTYTSLHETLRTFNKSLKALGGTYLTSPDLN